MITFAIDLRRKIGNWLNNGISVVQLKGFSGTMSKVKSIVILTQISNEKHKEAISILKKALKDLCPTAQLHIICYHPKEKVQGAANGAFISSDETEFFSDDSLSFFFKIQNVALRNLLQKEYDLAIAYYLGENIALDYILPFVNSGLKVGTSESQNANLVIRPSDPTSVADYCKHLIESLKMIFGS